MKILAIIPARYASTRFPGKPLALIHGKPMIQRVYDQVIRCAGLHSIVVATDDERIKSVVEHFGANVVMTSSEHQSGTERCAEVIRNNEEHFDVIINIQGDEPFIRPQQIELLCNCFRNEETQIATLRKKISHNEELFDPNIVKVVCCETDEALYFSRSPIPYQRGVSENYWGSHGIFYKHIGMYGYRKPVLQKIIALPVNALEKAESLEQLRWLSHGYRILTAITEDITISIDTLEDLHRAEKFFPEK